MSRTRLDKPLKKSCERAERYMFKLMGDRTEPIPRADCNFAYNHRLGSENFEVAEILFRAVGDLGDLQVSESLKASMIAEGWAHLEKFKDGQ